MRNTDDNQLEIDLEVGHGGSVVDSEVFSNTKLKSSIVSKTQGRIEFTPDDESRWRVPFPHPKADFSGETDFTVESCSNKFQTGLTIMYKGKPLLH